MILVAFSILLIDLELLLYNYGLWSRLKDFFFSLSRSPTSILGFI